jgi:hypothetical protein
MPDCHNSNPVFDNNTPDSKMYRNELARELSGRNKKDIGYWIDHDTRVGGKDYLLVFVQSDSLCAKMQMEVHNWGTLSHVKEVSSKSYSGAGLKNLQYDIVQDTAGARFVYKDVERIID